MSSVFGEVSFSATAVVIEPKPREPFVYPEGRAGELLLAASAWLELVI